MSKFVQLETVVTKEGHTLYALDDQGQAWSYDGTTRAWIALGTERMVPQSLHGPQAS